MANEELEIETSDKKIDLNLKQIQAIGEVYKSLKDLPTEVALKVIIYVKGMLDPNNSIQTEPISPVYSGPIYSHPSTTEQVLSSPIQSDDSQDGISSIGHKWMKRNGFESEQLNSIFSLGFDEIDIVAKSIPGKSMKEKMRIVFLLKGIASYLGSGVAKFTQDQAKEACQHYGAWDSTNASKYLKSFSSEVGTSSEGYILTPRGLTSATEVIKEMIS